MLALILAGGSGTRLWPLSRQKHPKQLQSLVSDKTLLEETIDRLDFLKSNQIFIATNQDYEDEIRLQAKTIPAGNIIIEPAMRDTATCICYSLLFLQQKFPDEVVAIIYADHLIKDKHEFVEKLKIAEKIAKKENTLNIIEVKARFPNTNLGYVKIGKMLESVNGHEVYEFLAFKEKPDLQTAEKYLGSYQYLWNTGYYVWKIADILEQYKKYLPETVGNLNKSIKALNKKNTQEIKKNYEKCQKISIDYAIMEKVNPSKVRIIPANLGWSDIGTWDSIYNELAQDQIDKNIIKGQSLNLATKNSLIYNYTDKLVATANLNNMVIVVTDRAILITKRDKDQNVKKIVEKLKEDGKEELL
ncbi:MAG: mannose-1-phosphate guanylyltransferase [Candidatus Peregrinibacteria bacterium GW2011_GWF2_33_10]|nr:MAG: mannose-1-phosphate guanylyltransferase [Candidatus Peregrinibacteria bacterium GW2011_GWF2_33_10]OGJ45869.1 MAG: hypothetical protein A2263_03500 [Candidatus Peregrinibacteria bacterium RIFOXYA2_FULL_33_21]OGJ46800.1 MAG: hypothetical protein A2272_06115 [Candidatus Peregrinibacteria bacterium RIFOXYA12_FULL_33_12]OGJ51429.1 MAG: hypothetical protein A2307_02400 [Candidatus Peregrinibacteria bacterium RIFOXYB2_FULL_33_20]